MNTDLAEAIAALLRQDLSSFIERCFQELDPTTEFQHNWHIDLIADKLTQVYEGKIRRLIINIPPRNLKSICASVAFPAWLLGKNPSHKIICASYAQDLAEKHARDCRRVMQSPWYRAIFPNTQISTSKTAAGDYETTAHGGRMAVSTGGGITGRGGDILIIDDPIKPDETDSEILRINANQWFDGTAYTRLNNKEKGAIVIIMQRLHLDDLVGHVLQKDGWEVLSLPAIAEVSEVHNIDSAFGNIRIVRDVGEPLHRERESLELLSSIRENIYEYNFSGQYQQSPVPRGGSIIKVDWLRKLPTHQWPQEFDQVFQSWDTASKASELADFSVCTTWGVLGKAAYLQDVYRKRMDFPELKQQAIRLYQIYKPSTILVEDKSSGIQLIQELKAVECYSVKAVKPQGDKKLRLYSQAAFIESGGLLLPDNAPWLMDYIHELTSFPVTRYDDQVDSTTQALIWLQEALKEPAILTYYKQQVEEMRAKGLLPP